MANVRIKAFGEAYELRLKRETYRDNGRLAIRLSDAQTGEPFGVLTTNDPQVELAPDEILVKCWSGNEGWYSQLLGLGIFEDTGRRESVGFCQAPVWRLVGDL